jgi:hypothetical protein
MQNMFVHAALVPPQRKRVSVNLNLFSALLSPGD